MGLKLINYILNVIIILDCVILNKIKLKMGLKFIYKHKNYLKKMKFFFKKNWINLKSKYYNNSKIVM